MVFEVTLTPGGLVQQAAGFMGWVHRCMGKKEPGRQPGRNVMEEEEESHETDESWRLREADPGKDA